MGCVTTTAGIAIDPFEPVLGTMTIDVSLSIAREFGFLTRFSGLEDHLSLESLGFQPLEGNPA